MTQSEIATGFIGFVAIAFAVYSPLLTFITLFQQKEWRWDRLSEHLRREGYVSQLVGKNRTILIGTYIAAVTPVAVLIDDQMTWLPLIALGWTFLFAALSVIQLVTDKQRKPVWTDKAMFIGLLSGLINIAAMMMLHFSGKAGIALFPFIFVLQPLFALFAWLPLIPVDTLLKKLIMGRAGDYRSTLKDVTVIGIAGSVGKTTTKELLNHVLQDLHPFTTPAHVNTEMGVAQWLLNKRKDIGDKKLLIVEMGAYRKGEIKLLSEIAQPTIGVMTALGSDHLALFGSEQAIVDANGELIESLPANGHAFFYGENDGCRELAKKAHCPTTLTNDFKTIDVQDGSNGLSFKLQDTSFKIPLHGIHNVHNILLAIAVAKHLKINEKRIAELLKSFKQTAHTFDVKEESEILILDDTYNISPLSFKAALEWTSTQAGRPRVLLTSGLQETGSEEVRFLKELGAQAKGAVERVIFTSPHGADIFASAYGKEVEVLSPSTKKVDTGSVLACVGRMPLSTITRLLP